MKNYLKILFFIFYLNSNAWAVTIDLNSVSVSDLCRVVFKEMLKADYVLTPDAVSSTSKLSLSLNNQPSKVVLDVVRKTLSDSGFLLAKSAGVFYISKEDEEEEQTESDIEYYTYKAKSRPVPFLSKLAKFAGANVSEGEGVGDVLVYSATDEVRKRLETLLKVVDSPAQAVTIRAALVEYSDSEESGQSLAISVLSRHLQALYKAGPSLGNSLTFIGGSVQVALSAISGDSRFSYLTQPMLRVLDGESARLSVGSEVPTRGAVTFDKNGNAIQSVQYQSSGVIFSVTPHFIGDQITLKIDQQISSFTTTTTSNIDSPSLLKRQAVTTIDAKRGQLIILAGLDEDKEVNSRSGLSFMPSWAWSDSKSKGKSQILLLLEVLEES